MRVPAVLAAVPLLGGTVAGLVLGESLPEHYVLASAGAAVFALIAGAGFLALAFDGMVAFAAVVGFVAAGFSAGASSARHHSAPPLLAWFRANAGDTSDPVTVIGRLRDDAAVAEYGASLTVDAEHVCAGRCDTVADGRIEGGARLSVGGAVAPADIQRWRAGRTVRLAALLRTPLTFRNPGVQDEARSLARRGIALTGSVKSAALVEVIAQGSPLGEAAGEARAWTRRILSRHLSPLSSRSAAIATAILIGDRTGLSDEDERRLQDAGTYHVIAISGGNIAIFTVMLLFVARVCRVPGRAAALAVIGALLFYGEIAGGAASVSRAISAAIVFLTARVVDHRGSTLNTVAVAAILAAAVSPAMVVDAGFLLSFSATVAIVLGVPRLLRPLPTARTLLALPAATLVAEIALAPIAAAFFARITAAGLVVNFAAIPLMALVQAGSIGVLGLAPLSPSWADRVAVGVHWSAEALVESARFVELAPWLAQDVPTPAAWLCALYYAACLGLLQSRLRRASIVILAVAMGLLVSGPAASSRRRVSLPVTGVLRVVFLDVGQGDATVVQMPDRSAFLVDAGGLAGTTFDIASRVVVPAMRALQVSDLRALVLTHADPDHIGGAEGVLQAFRPGYVWDGVPVPPHPARRALGLRAAAERVAWRIVRPGDVDRAGDVEVRVLHPPEPEWERQRVRNDDSVVLELRFGDVSILLPGDIGRDVERTLVPSLHLGRTVILKAPHHGSATSSSDPFLDALKSRAVIFSAGKHNRFGHPAKVVVDRYRSRGVEMFNTATDGAVFVETDGRRVRVRGWASGRTYSTDSH